MVKRASPAPPRTAARSEWQSQTGHQWTGFVRAWRAVSERLPRLHAETSRYLATRVDLAKAAVARNADRAVVGGLAAVVGITVLATAAALFIVGIAGALASAFDSVWLGNLVTGIVLLALIAGAVAIWMRKKRAARVEKLRDKYARFDRDGAAHDTERGDSFADGEDHGSRS